jgi:hypothetical protein
MELGEFADLIASKDPLKPKDHLNIDDENYCAEKVKTLSGIKIP